MILELEPATEFEEVGTVQFIVAFKRKAFESSGEALLGTATQKSSHKTSEITSEKILRAIRLDSRITISELAVVAGVTERSVERNIRQLQLENRLRRIGPDNGGYWEIVE